MTMAEVAVFEHWLMGGPGQTVAEVAGVIGVSESTLRKHAAEHGGCPSGCRVASVQRIISGWTTRQHYTATAWLPSDALLRDKISGMAKRLSSCVCGCEPRNRAEMEARG